MARSTRATAGEKPSRPISAVAARARLVATGAANLPTERAERADVADRESGEYPASAVAVADASWHDLMVQPP